MQNSNKPCFNAPFSHIYVEDRVRDTERCRRILAHFPSAEIIPIHHYKDVFNRKRQDYSAQHRSQALILAEKQGTLVYPGSPNCQSFGNANFYYTSCMMNCVFNCEYCYLKGMYPTGNLVLFLNLEDIFEEVRELCRTQQVYLCISYDTDLLALEPLTGYVRKWAEFAATEPNLIIEVRTKSANTSVYGAVEASDRFLFAYTLSPEEVIRDYEHGTASLEQRLHAASTGMEKGFPIRLCFDPMIYCPDWERRYHEMVEYTFQTLDSARVLDASVGTFRIAPDYLKTMRKNEPLSAAVQFPFVRENGVYSYGTALADKMEQTLLQELTHYLPAEKIFRWEDET
ncbi:MAG: radical SAM protein [Acutalibacteraceae bacterium]|nr:radical SAM protein [Acutalibacteraceae bacterium]